MIQKFVLMAVITVAILTIFGSNEIPYSIPLTEKDYCAELQPAHNKPLSSYVTPFQSQFKNKTGVYILDQGTEAMMSRAWLTEHAEKSIDIQYFIFSVDNIGLIATDYLVLAANRGVKVRILIDDIMLEARGDELLILAAHDNIELKIYNPNANIGKNIAQKLVSLAIDFHGFNQRMHNKVFIVDNQIAITGGRNIADEYFGFDHSYNFRDRDVFLAGNIVTDMKASFEEYWQYELSVPIEKLLNDPLYQDQGKPDFSRLHRYACDPENFHPDIRKEIVQVPTTFQNLAEEGKFLWLDNVEYISDKPGKNDKKNFMGGGGITQSKLFELISHATDSVLIQTPYLITTAADRAFLKQRIDDGVKIKILTNSLASTDNLEAFSGYQRNRKALLETGVKVYEFKPDAKIRQRIMGDHMYKKLSNTPIFSLHAKTLVIDNAITVIGTYNFDPRSANLNTESFTVIHSPHLTKNVKASVLHEMEPENAWRISAHFNPDNTVSTSKQIQVKARRIVPKNIL